MRVYCDGAASDNGNKDKRIGGWSYVIVSEDEQVLLTDAGARFGMTNNWGELVGMIKGCEKALELSGGKENITVLSDSAYCINCYKQGWWRAWVSNGWINSKKEPVANKELWLQLIPYFENPLFNFLKVKGHNGDKDQHSYWNNFADELAVKARTNLGRVKNVEDSDN